MDKYFVVLSVIVSFIVITIYIFREEKEKVRLEMASTIRRTINILCYGDSLTAGYHYGGGNGFTPLFSPYGSTLVQILHKEQIQANVDSFGFSGWTTKQLVETSRQSGLRAMGAPTSGYPGLAEALKLKNYDLLVLMGGTNDLGHGYSAREILKNLAGLREMGLNLGVKVIVIGIPESGFAVSNEDAQRRREAVNRGLESAASEDDKKFLYVECPVKFSSGSSLFERDSLHFSAAGYALLGQSLAQHVKTVLDL